MCVSIFVQIFFLSDPPDFIEEQKTQPQIKTIIEMERDFHRLDFNIASIIPGYECPTAFNRKPGLEINFCSY